MARTLLMDGGMIRLTWVLVLLGGCLYGGSDPCLQNKGGLAAAQELRDPNNGMCQGLGGGGTCGGQCGPCYATANGAAPTLAPNWAQCEGSCSALSESACLASTSCHAAYEYQGNGAQTPTFWGCWELPAGAVQGSCTNLDAQSCSQHTDCISTYDAYDAPGTANTYDHCAPEPTQASCAGVNCGTGNMCVLEGPLTGGAFTATCVSIAAAGSCNGAVACDAVFLPCPTGSIRGMTPSCYTPYCIPLDECVLPACSTLTTESTCKARTDCDPIYDGSSCTCDLNGCRCQVETFTHCQPL